MNKSWEGIVIHHSASPGKVWDSKGLRKISVEDIRKWHIAENFGDIGYHFIVDSDGLVLAGRSLDQMGAHCRANKRNYTSIGLCLVGNFQYDSPTELQLSSLILLVKFLKAKYQIVNTMVELHSKVKGAQTLCPGRYFPKDYFYKLI